MSRPNGPIEHRSRLRTILLAIGGLVGAGIVWGSLAPEPRRSSFRDDDAIPPASRSTGSPDPAATSERLSGDGHRPRVDPSASQPPRWVRPTIAWAIGLALLVVVVLAVLHVLGTVVACLLLALFFSFAMEPAVNYLHARWGWRRGAVTGLMLAVVLIGLVVLVLVFVPTLLRGAAAIAERLPDAARKLRSWTSTHLGVDPATSSIGRGGREAASASSVSSRHPWSVMLGFTSSLVGGLFGAFTVGTFTFYMVAEASQLRRVVLSFFPPKRQEELLSIWESAIEKTGGYFYSRLLLAVVNGGLFYVVLRILAVPGAASLAFFEGTVAAFIPIVGTYISAAVPIIVAFVTVGWEGALVLLTYVLIYQQVENYVLAPRIQGKTMQLHPAVAFGAALAGGAIGGLLWAFLALPFAATVQASASLWIRRHEVVETRLTHVEPPEPPADGDLDGHVSIAQRGERLLRSTRGWIRKAI
jgi:predicted PurR-regulated permease PerM